MQKEHPGAPMLRNQRHCTYVYDDSYCESINHHVVIDYQFLVECGEAPSWNDSNQFEETSPLECDSWPYDICSTLPDNAYETLVEDVFSFPTFPSLPLRPKPFHPSESSDSITDSDSDAMSDSEAEYSVGGETEYSHLGGDVPPDFPPPPPPLSPPLSSTSSQTPSRGSSTSGSATSSPPSSPKMEPKVTDQKLIELKKNLEGIKLEISQNISKYVGKMTILKNNFLNHPELSDKSVTLKKDDRTDLLMNVRQIAKCALILETAMDDVHDESSMKGIFRVLYEHFKKYYKHYVSYCTGIKGMQETLLRLKENRTFLAALTKIEKAEDNGGFGLSHFLDIPKERMFQMLLILTRASKIISNKAKAQVPSASDKIEAENCAKALEVVKEICEESNKNLALEDMRDIYEKFVFPDGMESPLSMTTLHHIVKKGEVTKLGESNDQTGVVETTSIFKWSGPKLWVFLFDHYILITRKRTRELAYDVKDFCPTDKAFIKTTKHLDSLQKDRDNKYMMVLVLEQNHKNERTELVLSCTEESDRDDWLDVLTSVHITIGVGTSNLYGKNLVDNCSGQDLLAHWNVTHNDGDGWKIEVDCDTWEPYPSRQASCFDTSYSEFSAKEQTIDLSAKGISPRRMDEEPHIHVGEWYAGRYDSNARYELIVELLNENKFMMTEYIFKEDIDESKGGKWKHVSHEFRNYGKGVRYVRFTHSGHNGCKMTEATVKIKGLTPVEKQPGDRQSSVKTDASKRKSAITSDPTTDSSSDEDDSKPVVEKSGSSDESVESNDDDDDTGLNASICFVCKKDLTKYIPVDGEVYCPACYEEKIADKCVKCKKAILSLGLTYGDQPWHKECFTCTHCSTELSGTKFTSRDEKPYCLVCYGELYAKKCATCCKPIAGLGDSRFVSAGDRDWHNDCFKCTHCRAALVGKGFFLDSNENITCAKCIKKQR